MSKIVLSKEQLEKIAAAEQRDRANAFELGFAKEAAAANLNEEQFKAVYQVGLELMQAEQK